MVRAILLVYAANGVLACQLRLAPIVLPAKFANPFIGQKVPLYRARSPEFVVALVD